VFQLDSSRYLKTPQSYLPVTFLASYSGREPDDVRILEFTIIVDRFMCARLTGRKPAKSGGNFS